MAANQIGGGTAVRNCQHVNLDFDWQMSETGSHHTGQLQIRNCRCPDCGQRFEIMGKNGPVEYGFFPLVERSVAIEEVLKKNGAKTPKPKPEPSEKKPEIAEGPGKELMRVFAGLGVPACQACEELANKMNEQGVDWCDANTDAIVADILPRAQEWLARPDGGWSDKLKARAPQFAQAAVLKRYVGIALRNWREKQELQSVKENGE